MREAGGLTIGVRTYDFRIEPRREGTTMVGVNAVGFDITPSKLAEAKLRETDRHKDEFLAILSHELRNPLTPLRLAFDVARMATNDPEQLRGALTVMDRQLQVISRLVDDLLDVSRIAQGKMRLVQAHVDPARVVEAALEVTRPLLDQHRHKLDVQLPKDHTAVLGDFNRLTQVLTNLLTNTAKYTPNGGAISVGVTIDKARSRVAVRIADNGIGIAPEVLPHVFDMFVQAREAEHHREGGLGVGLNLVRRIVELHGGSVAADSAGLGKGSVFTVELPLAEGA